MSVRIDAELVAFLRDRPLTMEEVHVAAAVAALEQTRRINAASDRLGVALSTMKKWIYRYDLRKIVDLPLQGRPRK